VLQPAALYAQNGFPVSERIASDWKLPNALPLRGCCIQLDPDSAKLWYVNGRPPVPGQIFRNPDLARTFRLLQSQGANVFYHGEIARAIVAKSKALGGTMTMEDLANYRGEWVEPAFTGVGGERNAQHSAGVPADVGAGGNACIARPDESAVLAHPR
jgi:gamma-glutamyltranspeptidase/glutathione hydrolase